MLIFWAITPLQSAIFLFGSALRTLHLPLTNVSRIMPVKEQPLAMNQEFIYKAYGSVWLNQTLPGFTNASHALASFSMDTRGALSSNGTWTALTTAYTSDLACDAATDITSGAEYSFTNRANCTINVPFTGMSSQKFFLQYIGWGWNIYTDETIRHAVKNSSRCSADIRRTFFGVASQTNPDTGFDAEAIRKNTNMITALFCKQRYYTQTVRATVSASNFSIINAIPLEPRQTLVEEIFNSTHFEDLLNQADPLNTNMVASIEEDYPQSRYIAPNTEVEEFNISGPYNLLVPFALKLSDELAKDFLNATTMKVSFEKVHQMLFALVINQLMRPQTISSPKDTVLVISQVRGVLLARKFVIVVNSLLAAVLVGLLILIYLNWNRKCFLASNPASINDIICMLPEDSASLQRLRNIDQLNSKRIKIALQDNLYELRSGTSASSHLRPKLLEKNITTQTMVPPISIGTDRNLVVPDPILPKEMSWYIGIPFIFSLFAAVVIILVLFLCIQSSNGKSNRSRTK